MTDFSIETTVEPRKAWNDVVQALKKINCQPRLPYPSRLTFKIEGEIKIFQDKCKLKNMYDH